MPVFGSGEGQAPKWCELEYFEIVRVPAGQGYLFARRGRKEKLILADGRCNLSVAGELMEAQEGANLDLPEDGGQFEVIEALQDSILVRMCGRWGQETGGSGIFTVTQDGAFERHYHDCDEYWIILRGRGLAVSEGKEYEVGPGDCVATGMGHQHDFTRVYEPVKAVYFETTLEGRKRRGHLWEGVHGKAEPQVERI